MIGRTVTVKYVDGTSTDVTISQYALTRLGPWRAKYGIALDLDAESPESIMLLVGVLVWAEVTRGKPADEWPDYWLFAATVADISPSEAAAVGPTVQVTGDTPSP